MTSRPGGYWLGYLVRGTEDARRKKKQPPRGAGDTDDDIDQGEAIVTSWIEVLPLDEAGAPASAPRAITPRGGRVLAFDLALGDDGDALLAWRDDDAPSGAAGGKVSSALVRLAGGGEPRVLLEQAGGPGAPDLLPGWISIASVNGATRMAALSATGQLLDDLAPEPALGAGEPVAARGEDILWARPMGKAMRLSVVRCKRRPSEGGP